MIDPRKLKPTALCRLLNSTPLGEVISEWQLRRHRLQAGLHIGSDRHIDLLRYMAWLFQVRHGRKPEPTADTPGMSWLAEAAEGAAVLGSRRELKGHGQKLTSKQEALIAALLTEPSYAAAAAQAGVSPATLYRWLHLPAFRAAYRQARRELVEAAIGRIQAGTGQAAETLLAVARQGKRDSDRVRAAVAVLDRALRGLTDADMLHGEPKNDTAAPLETGRVVQLLADRLYQLEAAELPTAEKSRLLTRLADALLRAIEVDSIDKRLEALEAALASRKKQGP